MHGRSSGNALGRGFGGFWRMLGALVQRQVRHVIMFESCWGLSLPPQRPCTEGSGAHCSRSQAASAHDNHCTCAGLACFMEGPRTWPESRRPEPQWVDIGCRPSSVSYVSMSLDVCSRQLFTIRRCPLAPLVSRRKRHGDLFLEDSPSIIASWCLVSQHRAKYAPFRRDDHGTRESFAPNVRIICI